MRVAIMNFKNLFSYILVSLLLLQPALASNNNLCRVDGYVICFFNGVNNTEIQALAATVAIQRMNGTEFNGQVISY